MNGTNQNETSQHGQAPDSPGQNSSYTSVDTSWAAVLKYAAPQIILRLALWLGGIFLVILVCKGAWSIITGLRGAGSDLGSTIIEGLNRMSIDPSNKTGFKNLLKMGLTALSFLGVLLILKRR